MLPLSCIINGKFIALHGGISPEMKLVKMNFTYNKKSSKVRRY